MREQLIQYVELLFAGAPNAGEIKQEILQNTLDRYDDLIDQGKSPEAAYRLAISGIGDINEILNGDVQFTAAPTQKETIQAAIHDEAEQIRSRKLRAVAVAMYILCPVPLFIFSEFGLDTLGLCMLLLMVAAATSLIMMARSKDADEESARRSSEYVSPQQELRKSVSNIIWAVGLAIYLVLSFYTQAWFTTWLIFPIIGAVRGLANAIIDLKEANQNET